MLLLSSALRTRGVDTVLLTEEEKVHHLCNVYNLPLPKVVNFVSPVTNIENDSQFHLNSMPFPCLDNYDVVVSDNLVEVLAYRPDAWLSGSFFWHKALYEFPEEKSEYADMLLRIHNPKMISTSLFAAPYLKDCTRLNLVGLYEAPTTSCNTQKTDILISCGLGGRVIYETACLLGKLESLNCPPCTTVWIEPCLHKRSMPYWMKPATFTSRMYSRVLSAIIRPGVGSATDALLSGARVFGYYENGNDEMKTNAARIESAGLGLDCKTSSQAWLDAVAYASDYCTQRLHKLATMSLDRDGASCAAKLILQRS